MHYCLQNLEIKNYTKEEIEKTIEEMQKKQKLTEKQVEAVNIEKLFMITKSNLWQRMISAKAVYIETPFYINVLEEGEKVLVQGIIDCYFIDEEDKVVLLDYKTDYAQTEQELIDKYIVQLQIYKEAIEQALHQEIDEMYIYSVYLNKEININA